MLLSKLGLFIRSITISAPVNTYTLIPLISFYLLIITIEGFVINNWDNLTIKFFFSNILNI